MSRKIKCLVYLLYDQIVPDFNEKVADFRIFNFSNLYVWLLTFKDNIKHLII